MSEKPYSNMADGGRDAWTDRRTYGHADRLKDGMTNILTDRWVTSDKVDWDTFLGLAS